MATITPAFLTFGPFGWSTRDVVLGLLALTVIAVLGMRLRRLEEQQRATIAELQQSTVHVSAIVDCSLDAIVAIDGQGRITQWNPAAEEMFGWREREALGRLVSETVIPQRYRQQHQEGLRRFHRTGRGAMLGRVSELTAVRRDGVEIPVDISINVGCRGPGESASFVAFIRDVTARRHAERLQGVRFIVASVLSDATSLPETVNRVLGAIASRLGYAAAVLWSPSVGGLRSQYLWAADRDAVAELLRVTRQTTLAGGCGLPGRVWISGRALTLGEVNAAHEDFARMAAAGQSGLRDGLAVPVIAGDRVLAVLEFFSAQRGDTDEALVRTLTDLAGELGQFIARRRAEMRDDSPERFHEILESAADAVVTVAEDGRLMALNGRARALFGLGTLEVLGEDLRSLILDRHRDKLLDYVADCLRHQAGGPEPPRWCELTGRRRDGTIVDFGLHLTPIAVGGSNIFMGLIASGALAAMHPYEATAANPTLRVYDGSVDSEPRPRPA